MAYDSDRVYIPRGAAYERYPAQAQRRRTEGQVAGLSGAGAAAGAAATGTAGAALAGSPLLNPHLKAAASASHARALTQIKEPKQIAAATQAHTNLQRGLKFSAKHRNKLTAATLGLAPVGYALNAAARTRRDESQGLSNAIGRIKGGSRYSREVTNKAFADVTALGRLATSQTARRGYAATNKWVAEHPGQAMAVGVAGAGGAAGLGGAWTAANRRQRKTELRQARAGRQASGSGTAREYAINQTSRGRRVEVD